MSLQMELHQQRRERLVRMHIKAVADTGVSMRNGWPVRKEPPILLYRFHTSLSGEFRPAWRWPSGCCSLPISEFSANEPAPLTVDKIIGAVCNFYSTRRIDLFSQRRTAALVKPRAVAMYLSKFFTGRSYPWIGHKFSRDHTTVLHAVCKIEAAIKTDADLFREVETIKAMLGRAGI